MVEEKTKIKPLPISLLPTPHIKTWRNRINLLLNFKWVKIFMPLDKKEIHFFTRMTLQTDFCTKIIKALPIKTQEKKKRMQRLMDTCFSWTLVEVGLLLTMLLKILMQQDAQEFGDLSHQSSRTPQVVSSSQLDKEKCFLFQTTPSLRGVGEEGRC